MNTARLSLDENAGVPARGAVRLSTRLRELHRQIASSSPTLCTERALLVTRYFSEKARRRPAAMILQKAEALCSILRGKTARIYPQELLVGCFTSHRVGGSIFPELHGVAMLEDLYKFDRRSVNPFVVHPQDRRQLLLRVLPFWATRFLAIRAMPAGRALKFIASQLSLALYVINESGGISHFVPDHQTLLTRGTEGFKRECQERLKELAPDSAPAQFFRSIHTVCEGLEDFARGYHDEATRLARTESDPARRTELERIASICERVPRYPARSFHEALQAILFTHIALNLESLDNSVCPGRLDQLLWPYYERDRTRGAIDRAGAFELLGCFALKLCEIVPLFSARATRIHGGMFNGQVVVVGGTKPDGSDATNELTYLFLELMDQLRTRQPNYHARLHTQSPAPYRARIAGALAGGACSPALYNDEVIVPILQARGVAESDARDYSPVGCVEPVAAGKSYFSTDAAIVNVPICLELALNQGRRFNERKRIGVATPPAESCASTLELCELLRQQLEFLLGRLLVDLHAIEEGNARFHPTPLTSMLLDGCLQSARDASSGGARYNGSGIQGVGVVEVGDSLAAIETVVFRQKAASLSEVIDGCRTEFGRAQALRARLRSAPKYGNDDPRADCWVSKVMELFVAGLSGKRNARGGSYEAGFYSITAHQAFGELVSALPSGRLRGEPFSSGLSPGNGLDRAGPTASLCSLSKLPLRLARNGVNFNLKLAPWLVAGAPGEQTLEALIRGGFTAGCMQLQINVLDPEVLIEARDNPGRHPGLLVRVSGYSAYFDDLSPEMKQEIIDRTLHQAGGA